MKVFDYVVLGAVAFAVYGMFLIIHDFVHLTN